MEKEFRPKTNQVFETIHNLYSISNVCKSLARACRNLERLANIMEEEYISPINTIFKPTQEFLFNLADMELHLHILNDIYQCDYEDHKDFLIDAVAKELHIS